MCLILYRPAGAPLPPRHLFEAAEKRNAHGMGMMWAAEGKLRILKRMAGVGEIYRKARKLADKDIPLAVHFRLATHGKRDLTNAHPVLVRDGLGMMHNGILGRYAEKGDVSDTALLAQRLLGRLPDGWWRDEAILTLVMDHIGFHNKLLLMDWEGNVSIVNETAGTWREGCWFSNLLSHAAAAAPVAPGGFFPRALPDADRRDERQSWLDQEWERDREREVWRRDYDRAMAARDLPTPATWHPPTRVPEQVVWPSTGGVGGLTVHIDGFADTFVVCIDCTRDPDLAPHVILRTAVVLQPKASAGLYCEWCGIELNGSGRSYTKGPLTRPEVKATGTHDVTPHSER